MEKPKFCGSAHFRGKTTNSVAWLKILQEKLWSLHIKCVYDCGVHATAQNKLAEHWHLFKAQASTNFDTHHYNSSKINVMSHSIYTAKLVLCIQTMKKNVTHD